jgi:hypothetical protein
VTDIVHEAGEPAAFVARIFAWEDVPRPASPEAAPILSVEGFAGPLDWLLEMAQARKIDLARLSIVALNEAFATAMQAALADRTGERTTEIQCRLARRLRAFHLRCRSALNPKTPTVEYNLTSLWSFVAGL